MSRSRRLVRRGVGAHRDRTGVGGGPKGRADRRLDTRAATGWYRPERPQHCGAGMHYHHRRRGFFASRDGPLVEEGRSSDPTAAATSEVAEVRQTRGRQERRRQGDVARSLDIPRRRGMDGGATRTRAAGLLDLRLRAAPIGLVSGESRAAGARPPRHQRSGWPECPLRRPTRSPVEAEGLVGKARRHEQKQRPRAACLKLRAGPDGTEQSPDEAKRAEGDGQRTICGGQTVQEGKAGTARVGTVRTG